MKALKKNRPILVSAPMADVSDQAFRETLAKYGKPDVMWTEFVSADGLCSEKGKKALIQMLKFSRSEKPLIAQIFGSDPEKIGLACQLIEGLGFDGVDINMGCPDRKIEKQGAGASLIKNPNLAREIILSAKKSVKKIPVSVKTRIGYLKPELETWLPVLLSAEPALITLHARTRQQLSKVQADWNQIKRAVEIRDTLKSQTLIFGNGDIQSLSEAFQRVKETKADGVMVGRALIGNPWFFNEKVNLEKISIKEKIKAMIFHIKKFDGIFSGKKSFSLMKKFFKAYLDGIPNTKGFKRELMLIDHAKKACEISLKWLSGQGKLKSTKNHLTKK